MPTHLLNLTDMQLFGEFNVYDRFFADLCLIMTGFDRVQRLG
jgi:hypothetical protein